PPARVTALPEGAAQGPTKGEGMMPSGKVRNSVDSHAVAPPTVARDQAPYWPVTVTAVPRPSVDRFWVHSVVGARRTFRASEFTVAAVLCTAMSSSRGCVHE